MNLGADLITWLKAQPELPNNVDYAPADIGKDGRAVAVDTSDMVQEVAFGGGALPSQGSIDIFLLASTELEFTRDGNPDANPVVQPGMLNAVKRLNGFSGTIGNTKVLSCVIQAINRNAPSNEPITYHVILDMITQ